MAELAFGIEDVVGGFGFAGGQVFFRFLGVDAADLAFAAGIDGDPDDASLAKPYHFLVRHCKELWCPTRHQELVRLPLLSSSVRTVFLKFDL
jgi:hypothetical protein